MATVLPRQWRPWLFAGLAFVGVGVVRWPLLWVLAPRAVGHRRGLEREGLMDRSALGALLLQSLVWSFLAVGGAPTLLPDIHRYVVECTHWMTSTQFAEVYALAQVAPGPNIMYVTLIGWQVAGWAGAAATTLPWLVPASTLNAAGGAPARALSPGRARRAIRRGLTPITIGLMLASGWTLMRAVDHDWRGSLLTLLAVVLVLRTPWNRCGCSRWCPGGMAGLV